MYVIVTCKYEMNPIKNVRENDDAVFPTVTLSVATESSGRIWPNFELTQVLMHVLITCKYEKDPIKNSGENVMSSFPPLAYVILSLGFFHTPKGSLLRSRILPNFELIQALIHVIVTCRYQKDPIKTFEKT